MGKKKSYVSKPKFSKKTTPAKRKRDGASSSSARPPARVADQLWSRDRLVVLSKKPFGAHQYLDWAVLEEYGLVQPIKQLLSSGPWETLFQILEPAYLDITLAFLATM